MLFAAVFAMLSCGQAQEGMKIKVTNPSAFDRSQEMVEIPMADINVGEGVVMQSGETLVVKNAAGEVVPSQVTYDAKLIFQSGLAASQSAEYYITYGPEQEFAPRTYGRHIAERKDDYAWENDKVAFRIYGPALEPIDGPSNGIDVWYKRTNDLIIDKWYADDLAGVKSYHHDHGEGQDDYKVGRSLGAGAMAPYLDMGSDLRLNGNYRTQVTLQNGPLRTTFKVTYDDMEIMGRTVAESRVISIDAGSQFSKVEQLYTGGIDMEVAAGITLRPNKEEFVETKNYVIYKNIEGAAAGEAYIAVVSAKDFDRTMIQSYNIEKPNGTQQSYTHMLAIMKYIPNVPVVYYTGYGWNKAGFENMDSFAAYVSNFTESLKTPLVVEY